MQHRQMAGCALVLVAALFLATAPTSSAWGAEATPPTAPAAAPAPTPALAPAATPAPTAAAAPAATPGADQAKGDVKYGDKWVPLETLFKDYVASRTELEGVNAKLTAAREKLMACQRRMTQMKNDGATADRPARADLAKARVKRSEYKKALDAKPPQKPTLQALPPQPRQPLTRSRSSGRYSSTGALDTNDAADQQYDQAMRIWENRSDIIKRQNDVLTKKYQQDLTEYKQNLNTANKELPKVEATIKTCDDKLDVSAKDLDAKLAPVLEEVKKDNEEVLGIQAQAAAVETRVKNMVEAIRSAPETVRFQHGIVEWEGLFYSRTELEKIYADTQAGIDNVREKLKAETAQSGQPFPAAWRHPQQDRMDALKALLDRVKAAGTPAKIAA
jgi:predicted  nucleic acid-binding Zn-ribbon protein